MLYFLRHPETNLVKIGTTENYSTRFSTLMAQHGDLELLGLMPGSYAEEKALHQRFAHLNETDELNGREWFKPARELMDYIKRYARLNLPLPFPSPRRYLVRSPRTAPMVDNFVNDLATLIREYQENNRKPDGSIITQLEIAEQADIDPATLSRYANNQIGSINLEVWRKLARFFRVPGSAIFEIVIDNEPEMVVQ